MSIKYKNVDFTEPLTRLLCSQLLERINKLPNEEVQTVDIETLIKNTVAYKKNVDAKTNSLIENSMEEFNANAYQAMKDENPKLYKKLKKFLKDNLKTS